MFLALVLFSLSFVFGPKSANAVSGSFIEIEDGAFLEFETSYNFDVVSNKEFNHVTVKLYGHFVGSDDLSGYVVADRNYNTAVRNTNGITFNTAPVRRLTPYYNPTTGMYLKNNLVFDIAHPDGTHSVKSIHCNIVAHELDFYREKDSTFYYNSPTENAFISSKTGKGNIVDANLYNCISYVLHEETNGWMWPFENLASGEDVTSWLSEKGYDKNTESNHSFCRIIAYGQYDPNIGDDSIAHFARVTDWGADGTPLEINSKWGQLEVIHSASIAPFAEGDNYGVPLLYYNLITENNASICYNPVTNTYYDSTYKTWNEATNSYDYIDVLYNFGQPKRTAPSQLEKKQCSDELARIYRNYKDKIDKYAETIPNLDMLSYVVMDDEKGAAEELINSSAPYLKEVFEIATHGGYENFDVRTAQFIINNVLDLHVLYSQPDQYLKDVKKQLKLATDAVEKYGAGITADECRKLQAEYGYLIVPALKDMGNADLLQLEKTGEIDMITEICSRMK